MSAFSIKQVKAILSNHDIPVEKLDACAEEICSRHAADLDSIKEERDNYKKDAETLVSVQQELKDLKDKVAEDNPFEAKYNETKQAFDEYKAQVEGEKLLAAKKSALKEIAKDAGLSEAGIAKALKYSDYDKIVLDEKGALKEKAALLKSIKEEWPEYIQTTQTQGANTATPPGGGNGSYKSKDEIMAIKDDAARQKAIAENHTLFGF